MTSTHSLISSRSLSLLATSVFLAACATQGQRQDVAFASNASMTPTRKANTARYEVSFVPSWNPATNPIEYPFTHPKQGFLTPTIGATHGPGYAIFNAGMKPTAGLEKLSETGKPSPLDAEIMAAIGNGTAHSIVRFSDGSPGPVHPTITSTFDISKSAPMISLVGMIAPSPDWFYGASCVELCQQGAWVANMTVPAFAWDSGGDGGATYLAEDKDLNPKRATQKATSKHFTRNGEPCPVGYFVFKQIPAKS